MNRRTVLPANPIVVFALLSVSLSSCAIFGALGDSVSRGYENAVSYFNAYYNAKRLFDEAEAAVLAAERSARERTTPVRPVSAASPGNVREKFNAVIDKCSSILSFYPNSALVDDALLLIGKSQYYQQDYLKAERKFSELIVQFPNSDLRLEAQLWLARSLERQSKRNEAILIAAELVDEATERRERALAADSHFLLGMLYEQEEDEEAAIQHYIRASEMTRDAVMAGSALTRAADLFYARRDYERALGHYTRAFARTSDTYLSYSARLQAARCYAATGRYSTALYMADQLLDDIRYQSYHPAVRLERAGILASSGQLGDALEEYRFLDTTYVRTETGARASYQLGMLYETTLGDLAWARHYYARAASLPAIDIAPVAKRKEAAYTSYLFLRRELSKNDSLLRASDSLAALPPELVDSLAMADSTHEETLAVEKMHLDSLAAVESELESAVDTLEAISEPAPPKFAPLNRDSMLAVQARIAYDLGEVFYTELENRDSSAYWFQRAYDLGVDSVRAPRVLFILAEIARDRPRLVAMTTDRLYQQLIDHYPASRYALEAQRILGHVVHEEAVDSAEEEYRNAEMYLWSGQIELALDLLRKILRENPRSPYAAKSAYAIGWIYENRLAQPDSALKYYRDLVQQHASSPYAAAVQKRITELPAVPAADEKPPGSTPGEKPEREPGIVPLSPPREQDEVPVPRLRTPPASRDTTRTIIKE